MHIMKDSLGPRSWVRNMDFRLNILSVPAEKIVNTVDETPIVPSQWDSETTLTGHYNQSEVRNADRSKL